MCISISIFDCIYYSLPLHDRVVHNSLILRKSMRCDNQNILAIHYPVK